MAALEEVGGEGVAKGVAGHSFVEAGLSRSVLDGTLYHALVEMMPALQARRFLVARSRRKDPLPAPRPCGGRDFSLDGLGQPDMPEPAPQVRLVHLPGLLEL